MYKDQCKKKEIHEVVPASTPAGTKMLHYFELFFILF